MQYGIAAPGIVPDIVCAAGATDRIARAEDARLCTRGDGFVYVVAEDSVGDVGRRCRSVAMAGVYDGLCIVAICTTEGAAQAWAQTGTIAALLSAEEDEATEGMERWPVDSEGMVLHKAHVCVGNRPLYRVAEMFLEHYEGRHEQEHGAK